MATSSSLRNIKSRMTSSNSINNVPLKGNEQKSTRTYLKKPMSATTVLPSSTSTNGFNHHVKTRHRMSIDSQPVLSVAATDEKSPTGHSHHHNGHHHHHHHHRSTTNHSSSPRPTLLYAIAPAPLSEELDDSARETHNNEKQVLFLITSSKIRDLLEPKLHFFPEPRANV